MKLSEYKGEKALDMLADLMEPAVEIMADKNIADSVRGGATRVQIAKTVIKSHKKAVIEIMAILEGENPKEYAEKVNLFTLPAKLLELFNDPELMSLFTSQGQKKGETTSGSATESTEESQK